MPQIAPLGPGDPVQLGPFVLAGRIGAELLHFPGGHTGLTTHPVEFGELLRKALRA